MIIEGVNIEEKNLSYIGIRKIFGIGKNNSVKICEKLKIAKKKIFSLINSEKISLIKEIKKYKIENNLKSEIYNNIKKLIEIKSYRGDRHKKLLPSRGQNTRNNANTRRKKKVLFFIKK
ncbi:ribosomal protein uS13 [Candidatus Vidania fulgoroideorum]